MYGPLAGQTDRQTGRQIDLKVTVSELRVGSSPLSVTNLFFLIITIPRVLIFQLTQGTRLEQKSVSRRFFNQPEFYILDVEQKKNDSFCKQG